MTSDLGQGGCEEHNTEHERKEATNGESAQLVRRGKKDRRMGAPSELDWEAIEALRTEMRVELIQELIPLGLAEVGRVLDEEVERLAGPRHARKGEGEVIYRHGSNPARRSGGDRKA